MSEAQTQIVHNVVEPLLGLLEPIEGLKGLPGNARRGDVEALKRSYVKWGQRKPVVSTLDGVVTAGNHSLLAMKELGWTHCAVVRCDDDDREAVAFALTDNRTHDLGDYDQELLADALKRVDDPALLDVTGYDAVSIQAIFERVAPHDRNAARSDVTRGGGSPVIQYQLVFDSEDQQQVWFRFVRWLKRTTPGDTLASRLAAFLGDVLPDEDAEP